VTDRLTADSSAGFVEVEFGVNRWVMVAVGSAEKQEQMSSERELASYLEERGLFPNEAEDIAHKAWNSRPRDAAGHLPPEPPNWSLFGATSWRDVALVIVLVSGVVLLLVYLVLR
jgi:hypothetical protein